VFGGASVPPTDNSTHLFTMTNHQWRRCLRPATLMACGTLVLVSIFIPTTLGLPPISALLPGAILAALSVLALLLLIQDQREAAQPQQEQTIGTTPHRALQAFALIVGYALSVEWFGFYPSTAVGIPLTAYVFGYREPKGLLLATAIATGGIYLIFSYAMAQEFPSGLLWSK